MQTWLELEERFKQLEAALHFSRLDKQFGTDGESWRLAAASDQIAAARFEALCSIAGRKLRTEVDQEILVQEVVEANNDLVRWYRMISSSHRFYRPDFIGQIQDNDGNKIGWIGTGTIRHPAAVSAATCLEIASMTIEPPKSSLSNVTVTLTGEHNRVNIGSTDNSINNIDNGTTKLFAQIRDAIDREIKQSDKPDVLARLASLEAAQGTPTFVDRYQTFMQSVANHATVLAPFLPGLASLLTR